MENFNWSRVARSMLMAGMLVLCPVLRLSAAETNPPPDTVARIAPVPGTNANAEAEQQQIRAYLRLQEQLHSTLLAIEQARVDSSAETRTNAEILAARLEFLEKTLAQQREQQLQSMQDSHRTTLLFAGSVVGVGLLALAFTALYQSRGMNRLSDIATNFSQERALLAAVLTPTLGHGEKLLLANGSLNGAGHAMAGTIERLERRIRELESSAQPSLPFMDVLPANGDPRAGGGRNGGANLRGTDQASVLLGKGQVLLNLGQAEGALACFDEAAAVAPGSAEVLVKRGNALERLKRFDEAIACYDRAISLNPAHTQAYLSKGGIYNQQERYSAALECYEEALRTEGRAAK